MKKFVVIYPNGRQEVIEAITVYEIDLALHKVHDAELTNAYKCRRPHSIVRLRQTRFEDRIPRKIGNAAFIRANVIY